MTSSKQSSVYTGLLFLLFGDVQRKYSNKSSHGLSHLFLYFLSTKVLSFSDVFVAAGAPYPLVRQSYGLLFTSRFRKRCIHTKDSIESARNFDMVYLPGWDEQVCYLSIFLCFRETRTAIKRTYHRWLLHFRCLSLCVSGGSILAFRYLPPA